MVSVVIAAHNEQSVISATLTALLQQPQPVEVIVCANGCTDNTIAVASRPGVTVLHRAEPGKSGALNAADEIAMSYPRIYLDADIVVPPDGISAILKRFGSTPAPLAIVPRRKVSTARRPWPVRAYFSINERLPAFRNGLFGRGMIALSQEGRARFSAFPDIVADDLFLDSQFADSEKAEAGEVEVVVEAPYTTRDLLRRLVRVRRGNAHLRAAGASGELGVAVRSADRWAWLREVVLPEPRLALAAIPYLGITVTAALLALRQPASGQEWARDESTRRGRPPSRGEGTT